MAVDGKSVWNRNDLVTLELPPDLEQELAWHARRARVSPVVFACRVLAAQMEELEDERIARQRLERVSAGKSCLYSAEEAKRELGL